MSEPKKANIDDSTPSVTLSVGQLREVFRQEMEKGANGNGYRDWGDLLDAEGAASHLCVPVSKVRNMARKGELPCVRIGYYIRFQPEDLDQYIKDHKG